MDAAIQNQSGFENWLLDPHFPSNESTSDRNAATLDLYNNQTTHFDLIKKGPISFKMISHHRKKKLRNIPSDSPPLRTSIAEASNIVLSVKFTTQHKSLPHFKSFYDNQKCSPSSDILFSTSSSYREFISWVKANILRIIDFSSCLKPVIASLPFLMSEFLNFTRIITYFPEADVDDPIA